jgi:hypothetical protein
MKLPYAQHPLTSNYASLTAMAHGVYKRYSVGHRVTNFFHELPESVDINKPQLLTKNSP